MKRRDFLATGALAAASLPLLGCKPKPWQESEVPKESAPIHVYQDYFYRNFGVTQEMIDKVLSKALSRGGQWGELFFEHSRKGELKYSEGLFTSASIDTQLGMGVRCVADELVGYAFTESLTLEDMLRAAEAAAAIAPGVEIGKINSRIWPDFKRFYDVDYNWDNLDILNAKEFMKMVESRVRAKDTSIENVSVKLRWHQRTIMINTSDGINAEDSQPYYGMAIFFDYKHGDEVLKGSTAICGLDTFESVTKADLDRLIDDALKDLWVSSQKKIRPKGGEWPMIVRGGVLIHETIGHPLEADFNRKNQSIMASKMNQKIAADEVNIYDSGQIENNNGAINFDDEGTPSQKTVLVENGVLKSYLHDKISARHYGVTSTGSGRRASYRNWPIPRMRSICLENGTHEVDELIHSVKYGVFVRSMPWAKCDYSTGNYLMNVESGYLIEDGKLTAPIGSFTIIASILESMKKIMIANDLKNDQMKYSHSYIDACGKDGQVVNASCKAPTVLVSSVSVVGE